MNKRIIALVMALVLCLASTAALAANSKTTYDIITTDSPVITVAAPTAESKAELDAIAKFVNDGQPVVTYFDEAVQTSIAASLPAGIDASALKMDEFFALSSTGSMTVGTSMTLSTAAVYAAGDAVITLGGIVKDDQGGMAGSSLYRRGWQDRRSASRGFCRKRSGWLRHARGFEQRQLSIRPCGAATAVP